MTRFQQEISGALGQWWKEQAEKELEDAVRKADADAIVEPEGAIKWVKSGNYLMDDFCEMLEYAGYPFSREATAKSRDIQNSKFIEEYKKNYTGPSEEELFEMRAAFGDNGTVIGVITGNVIELCGGGTYEESISNGNGWH